MKDPVADAVASHDLDDDVRPGSAVVHLREDPPPSRVPSVKRSPPATFPRLELLLLDSSVLLLTALVCEWFTGSTHADAFIYAGVSIAVLVLRAEYRLRGPRTRFDAYVFFVVSLCVGAVLTQTAMSLTGDGRADLQLLIPAWLASLVAVPLGRGLLAAAKHIGILHPDRVTKVLIVGTGAVGSQLATRLLEYPEYRMEPVGFLDVDSRFVRVGNVPYLGGPSDLERALKDTGAKQVILAFSPARDAELMRVIRQCERSMIDVAIVPRFYDSVSRRVDVRHVGGLPMIVLGGPEDRQLRLAVKSGVDRMMAGCALLVMAPLLAGIALAVRLSSPGPVLFRQQRVGRDGEVFELLKFRSMAPPAAAATFRNAPGLAPGGIENDDRRTRVGTWLRRTALDELPQLLNVVRGQMSLVGPRPERPEFVERFNGELPRYHERHRMKPGITGWSQVHGLRGQTSIAKRAEWDNYYIENFSLRLDLKILILTVAAVLQTPSDA